MILNLLLKCVRLLLGDSDASRHRSGAAPPGPPSRAEWVPSAPPGFATRVEARVLRVVDGDTVIVRKGRCEIRVRLDSIDCPEHGQAWGEAAKFGLVRLIGGRDVLLEEHGLDCHGRLLATIHVWHDKRNQWFNVNEKMVTLGHAWVMRRCYQHLPRDRQVKLNQLERWARSKSMGLWQAPSPTPPWSWRRMSRVAEESSTSVG